MTSFCNVSHRTASHRTISNVSHINGTALQHSYLSLSQCAYRTASHLPYIIPFTLSHHTHRTFCTISHCIVSHRIASNNTVLSETCHNFLYRVDIPSGTVHAVPYRTVLIVTYHTFSHSSVSHRTHRTIHTVLIVQYRTVSHSTILHRSVSHRYVSQLTISHHTALYRPVITSPRIAAYHSYRIALYCIVLTAPYHTISCELRTKPYKHMSKELSSLQTY